MRRFIKPWFFLVIFFFLKECSSEIHASASGQTLIDSLKQELKGVQNDSIRANLYYQIAYNYDMIDPKAGAEYARKGIALADTLGYQLVKAWGLNALAINLVEIGDYAGANSAYQQSQELFQQLGEKEASARVLVNHGTLFVAQSIYPEALEKYQKAIDVFKDLHKEAEVAKIMVNIGNIYGGLGDHESAIPYYHQALKNIGSEGNPTARAVLEGNLGIAYHDLGRDSLAEDYFAQSLSTHRDLGNHGWVAQTLGNLASVRYDQNRFDVSATLYEEALAIYRELQLESHIAWILIELGLVEHERGNTSRSLGYCREALSVSEEIESLENKLYACDCLAKSLEKAGRFREALAMSHRFIALQDSMDAAHNHQEVVRLAMKRSFQAQQKVDSLQRAEENLKTELLHNKAIHRKDNQRNLSIFMGLIVILIAGGLWGRLRYTRQSKRRIEQEKEVSESLLLNILPAEVARELKEKGSSKARRFENVTVLFTDFKGFTAISEQLSAEDLVQEIDHCFKEFDEIIDHHKLEKIKTIGDAYMAAGGLPIPTDDSAKNTVLAALEMQEFIKYRKSQNESQGRPAFEMRVGTHTGPVVAGIVGVKKFQYDIWGDTVNTASRMESSSKVGHVNISEATYELIKNNSEFEFTSRGKVQAKGKGEMEMYFVSGRVKD